MRLIKLTIENYKCFAERTEFDFTANGGTPGGSVFLVGGMNGAGKTSLMEALNICLYGEKEAFILERISRGTLAQGEANCLFELQFDMGDGEILTLKRRWEATQKHDVRASDLRSTVRMHLSGSGYTTTDEDQYRQFVAQHIPSGITQFFFFDGEKIQEMADDEKSEYRLRTSMEAALGIENVRRLADDIKNLRRQERRSDNEISDDDIILKENELTALRRKLEKNTQALTDVDNDIAELTEEREDAERQFKSSFGFNHEDKTNISTLERKRSRLQTERNGTEDEIKKYISDHLAIALLGEHFATIEQRIAQEASGDRTILDHCGTELAGTITAKLLAQSDGWLRPTISKDAIHNEFERIILQAVSEFSHSEAGANEHILNYSIDEQTRVRTRLHEISTVGIGRLKPLIERKRRADNELGNIEKKLGNFRPSAEQEDLMERLLGQITTSGQHIGNKRGERDSLEKEHKAIQENIKKAENDLAILYDQYEASEEQTAFLGRCEALEKLLDRYVDELRKSRIDQLQQKTLEMYRLLATKGDLISDISIDPHTYQVNIRDRNGHTIRKKNISAGEKEVFAVSLLWGLAQTSELRLPIVIDTPLSRLDSKHRDAIVTHYFAQAGPQVIVLSTDTEVDQEYYERLEAHLQHSIRLRFHPATETTTIEEGYFTWR